MQTEEQKIFRFNWQVGAIIALTAVALIIPLAAVVIGFKQGFHSKPAPSVAQPEPPFRQSLEDLANQKLGSETSLGEDQNTIDLEADDVDAEAARIGALARIFSGVALPGEKIDGVMHLTVQLPGDQLAGFTQACHNKGATTRPSAPDETRVLVKVVIKSKHP